MVLRAKFFNLKNSQNKKLALITMLKLYHSDFLHTYMCMCISALSVFLVYNI